jgi:hypothetical protein
MFLAPWFFIAGLILAAAPVVIHLLNRRRYRTVPWAAMDFLREALVRSRRMLQLRDLLLLALRMLVILAFGAALARPFLGGAAGTFDPDSPVHAVLLIDNSLSTEYQRLRGTVLDEVKGRARELVQEFPRGSRISVLPTCGDARGFSYSAYFTPQDALDAIERIVPVDRATRPTETIDLALESCRRVPDMPRKRIVLVADQQIAAWPAATLESHLKQLPAPLEIVEVAAEEVENAWIVDFRLRDGVADVQTPGVFLATIGYQGQFPRHGVQVTLTVDGVSVAAQTVDLMPGQMREVEFPPHSFNVPIEPGKAAYATAEVSIPQDRLPADDQRFLAVPVVAGLPVVFVDQFGPEESLRHGRQGETFYLRRLLAPLSGSSVSDQQPIRVRHLKIDQLDRGQLADARAVVVAGVLSPDPAVDLLREYVQQGGNLVIAAGGDFDPGLWTRAAWREGLGILPAPLEPAPFGRLPEEDPASVQPFRLDFESMVHGYFLLESTSRRELEDLYSLPLFFKAVEAIVTEDVKETMVRARTEQLQRQREAFGGLDRQAGPGPANDEAPASGLPQANREDFRRQRELLRPNWLLAAAESGEFDESRPAEEIAEDERFQVLARYSSGQPFMVERRIGQGKVLLVTTGLSTRWTTLPITDTVLIYDRIVRDMLHRSLPKRNLSTEEQMVVPIAASERAARFRLITPEEQLLLSVDALGGDRYGITLRRFDRRGSYRLAALRREDQTRPDLETKLWEITLAVNGLADESQLVTLDESHQRQQRGLTSVVGLMQPPVEGLAVVEPYGGDLWKWLLAAVLALLLVELLLLAWPVLRGEQAA